MINMKLTGEEKETQKETVLGKTPEYPYGLSISLDEYCLEKLGIKEMPEVGKAMTLQAKVEVTSISEHQNQNEKSNRSLSLQITDMSLEGTEEKKDTEETLYGKNKEKEE